MAAIPHAIPSISRAPQYCLKNEAILPAPTYYCSMLQNEHQASEPFFFCCCSFQSRKNRLSFAWIHHESTYPNDAEKGRWRVFHIVSFATVVSLMGMIPRQSPVDREII